MTVMSERSETSEIDPRFFRDVLGEFPTGIVVVTAVNSGGEPLAMTIGSFTSVSLDPPLVAFFPSKTSASWAALNAAGNRLCVNILAAGQSTIATDVASRKVDRLRGIPWRPSPGGQPVIEGCVAHIDGEVLTIHDGGDHHIVVLRVLGLAAGAGRPPLIFHRGSFATLAATPSDAAFE
jgi:3-hydroxy-9,10-secoandrosta-1,3,5(10)-triene-9,17-dione monooxygenase reductase component